MDGRLSRRTNPLDAWPLVLLFMLPGLAQADSVNAEWLSTTRALTMGNVGIASSDDPSTSTFYNPAALARSKKPVFEAFNPQTDFGFGNFSLSKSVTDWGKHSSYNASKELTKAKPGTASSVGFSLFPNVSSQNFSFGLLGRMQRWSYYKESDKTWRYYSRYLMVPTLGISMAIMGGRVRFGAAVRAIQITETNGTAPDTGSTVTNSESTGEGLGIGLDTGMLITMPWSSLPSLGLVARNVGDTAFPTRGLVKIGGGGKVDHAKIKMMYDAGFAITPKINQRDTLAFAVDMRDIQNRSQVPPIRHINVGMELGIGKKFFLRAGYSQAYWTAGIGLASKEGSLDLGTYGDELDPSAVGAVEDRKFSVRFTKRF